LTTPDAVPHHCGMRQTTPPILSVYSAAEHRARLEHIRLCERSIRACRRRHLVTSYIPGQHVYSLRGEGFTPSEEDNRELSQLAAEGVGLIQIWSEFWNNCWGGGPMYSARNQAGLQRLIEMVHAHGMRIIPYTSSNFFERTDPHFSPTWSGQVQLDLVEQDFHLAHCSPGSPGWRAHLLSAMIGILDRYDFDGLYNDMGYHRPADIISWQRYYSAEPRMAEEDVIPFDQSADPDGAAADMLALIYSEVKRRGGVYKLHKEGVDRIRTPLKVYDYLWVGEAVLDIEFLRQSTRDYEPYVIPEFSRGFSLESEEELYLNAIPYLHFPVSRSAKTGGAKENRSLYAHWLERYLPMVEEGTWAYLDIHESSLFAHEPSKDVVATALANRSLWLVLANFGRTTTEVSTRDGWVADEGPAAKPNSVWKLEPRSLTILRRVP
jgi:hypothetical protein